MLGLPNPGLPFTQFVYQKDNFMTSVLTQSPVNVSTDLFETGLPLCLKADAAAEKSFGCAT